MGDQIKTFGIHKVLNFQGGVSLAITLCLLKNSVKLNENIFFFYKSSEENCKLFGLDMYFVSDPFPNSTYNTKEALSKYDGNSQPDKK